MLLENLNSALRTGLLPEVGVWGYVLLAILVAFEGPIATLLGAAAASAGLMKPWLVFFSAAAGNLIADSLWYSIGYAGRIEWVFKIGRGVGLRHEQMEHLKHNMLKHATKILFLAKLTMTFMIPSLISAGLARVPWKRWFPSIFAGEMLWTGSLVLIGFYATEAIKRVEQGIEYGILIGSIIFLVIVLYFGRRFLKVQEEKDEEENQAASRE
jgi:membrane-associated protein